MSNNKDFVIRKSVLKKYTGTSQDVIIPDGITSIGAFAFSDFKNLTSIVITDGVTSIGENAFENCTNLTSITLPDSLTSIGKCAFDGCKNLTSVTIPDNVQDIGAYAFRYCLSIKNIVINNPECVIDGGAFYGSGLISATIPILTGPFEKKYSCLPDGVFRYCRNLKTVEFTTDVRKHEYYRLHSKKPIVACYSLVISIGSSFEGTAIESIYAPKCNISELKTLKVPAAIGFAKAIMNGEKIGEEIENSYKKYIKGQRKKLCNSAIKHIELLRYMVREKIITASELSVHRRSSKSKCNRSNGCFA